MDLFHRKSEGSDTRTGHDSPFCLHTAPLPAKPTPTDPLVTSQRDDTPSGHLTEDGYVNHRLAELLRKRSGLTLEPALAKSA